MLLQIITPKKIVFEEDVKSVTVPSTTGDITVLNKHMPLFSQLTEGIITVKRTGEDVVMAIGGGYLETGSGKTILLVSRAYGQDEIDEKAVLAARDQAEKDVASAPGEAERTEALEMLRRTTIDLKLLGKIRRKRN
ncbi:ATP synthase F1 subunit epsilon [Candidatus Roizmanbacteria bacterium RIFCSPHIGHO2_02_FULL_40_13b]|uniref:ATP synthase epsilon chain n=1 Tax=Candidatus Roizmanbacteria bacterium RIFCSPHIGHO2_01_FULL_39_24 TaxID=1802032 RepID=A0A1F7GFI1_9BACT|nr:MAG: ATP synthase F1 subunit epsilon [Candidatus Roizmanbacteria bacterium RIFCSPHIGHO2_01_FULL_39_24]OGK26418.1 MAG: ATP synthase F1 subunit epsilon [Candidatus Roizmanbacteria bacterium RIFCSPHIGHO2_02_FULL_40_13b]OGK49030.1 MAG: ATP synthase F1 subunit epsilon [Candidatus Roizmanbacteria bacterium RIFCSPLOWO2_01_FULL_40_32]OGK57040.1 MAG: ATP synthase F1 subunit epsilon [Candidatus Roizmanbacteria bacterium RIFCSPLOWO2_02_FULL_39_8]